MDIACTENCAQLNTNKINTKEINKDGIKYLSINQRAQEETVSTAPDESHDRWKDRYNKTLAEIKDQIDYDTLILANNKELINDIAETMTEVLTLDTQYYTICGKEIPAELVRLQYRKITYGRLESFLIELSRRRSRIGNTKRYLISALYNVASTAETAMVNLVNCDLYSGS